jgi:hypothetical protein
MPISTGGFWAWARMGGLVNLLSFIAAGAQDCICLGLWDTCPRALPCVDH